MAHLPPAFSCHLSRVASRLVPLACTAKSMMVVVPPQAAALVPVSNVSTEEVPPNGISMCVCASMPPGSTYRPDASSTRSAACAQDAATSVPGAASAATRSPSMRTSISAAPVELSTEPPLTRMRIAASGLRLDPWPVGVPAPIPVEGPQIADLPEPVHVKINDDDIVGAV